jgi:hypothetical protein
VEPISSAEHHVPIVLSSHRWDSTPGTNWIPHRWDSRRVVCSTRSRIFPPSIMAISPQDHFPLIPLFSANRPSTHALRVSNTTDWNQFLWYCAVCSIPRSTCSSSAHCHYIEALLDSLFPLFVLLSFRFFVVTTVDAGSTQKARSTLLSQRTSSVFFPKRTSSQVLPLSIFFYP